MQSDDSIIIFNGCRIRFDERPWSASVCNGPSWGTLYPIDEPNAEAIGYATRKQFFAWLKARRTMEFPEIVVNGRACLVA